MTNYYLLDRIAGRNATIRAADADRERVAERLRRSLAEGRLDMAEFQDRLERCYTARTLGELGDLVRDLPRQEAPADSGLLARLPPLRRSLRSLAAILIALIVVSAALGHHVFWLWIPLVLLIWRLGWWQRRRWFAGARRGREDWI